MEPLMTTGPADDHDPAARSFFTALRDLHLRAGKPSSRQIAQDVEGVSHTTVSAVLRGSRLPSWPIAAKLVESLGGNVEQVRELWVAAQASEKGHASLPAPVVPQPDVSVFVSYARIDDEATYGRISQFVKDIGSTYRSFTGRQATIFQDKDSIAPGEDWRDRIRLGLSSSSIFLPFITPAYLRSIHCREELWEFLGFLQASKQTRLIIPLIYSPVDRIEKSLSSDDLWLAMSKLNRIDKISLLRLAEAGSPDWLSLVELVADRIDEVLSNVASVAVQTTPSADTQGASKISPLGMFEKLADLEKSAPKTQEHLERVGVLFAQLGEEAQRAEPSMRRADTFSKKLAASTRFATRITPIAEEFSVLSKKLVSGIGTWDDGVLSILEKVRERPAAGQDPEFGNFVEQVTEMADAGISSLSHIADLYGSIDDAKGMSAQLDKPLGRIQESLLEIAELSAMFRGWKSEVELLSQTTPNEHEELGSTDHDGHTL
jgi:DNA-binding XRE family transcriptional regulator